jgi:hypothetical protein
MTPGRLRGRTVAARRGGRLEDGAKLWARLVQLASENRATGGYFDLPKLIQALRPDFDLQDHPDLRADWSKLDAISEENIDNVRGVLGTDIRLARAAEKLRLSSEAKVNDAIVVAGESGSGKSTIVSQLVGSEGIFKRAVWLNAEQLSKTSQVELANALGLGRRIPELIAMSAAHPALLVIDGFERFEGEARKRASELLRAVKEEGFVGWKVIVTCQPQSLDSAHDFLVEAGIADIRKVDFGLSGQKAEHFKQLLENPYFGVEPCTRHCGAGDADNRRKTCRSG